MEQATTTAFCPSCNLPVLSEFYFCPNCGRALRNKSVDVSVAKQIGVYLLSFLLPPLGLYPGIKYIRQNNARTQLVGWIAIGLTILSIAISIVIVGQVMQQYAQLLNSLGSPLSY